MAAAGGRERGVAVSEVAIKVANELGDRLIIAEQEEVAGDMATFAGFLKQESFRSEDCRMLLQILDRFCWKMIINIPDLGDKVRKNLQSAYRRVKRGLEYPKDLCLGDLGPIFVKLKAIPIPTKIRLLDYAPVVALYQLLGLIHAMWDKRYGLLARASHRKSEGWCAVVGIEYNPARARVVKKKKSRALAAPEVVSSVASGAGAAPSSSRASGSARQNITDAAMISVSAAPVRPMLVTPAPAPAPAPARSFLSRLCCCPWFSSSTTRTGPPTAATPLMGE